MKEYTATALVPVQFHGQTLVTTQHNGEPHVAMRPIVEAVGLNWKAQYDRIQRDDVLRASVVMMTTVAEDGKQRELVCLPLKLLNGWLFGIDTGRLKPELRETIGTYKRECYDALYRYWHEGQAINPRFRPEKTRKALPGGLTVEQQDAVKALVKSRVEILPHGGQAKAAITCWSAIKSKFGVSYKEVPATNFTDVLSLVARLPLESDNSPPFLQGEIGTRVLVRLEGGGRYSVTPLAITETVVDLADLVAIDQALDAWRDFAKRKELSYYRAGVANLRSNGH